MIGILVAKCLRVATWANLVADMRNRRRPDRGDNVRDLAHPLSQVAIFGVDPLRPRGQGEATITCRTHSPQETLMVSHAFDRQRILATTYLEAHVEAVARCARISELLFDLPSPDGEVPITWGHIGDLGEVNRRLQLVLEFLERPTP